MTTTYPRVLGLLTLSYGLYTAIRPESLLRAAELEPPGAPVSRSGRTLASLIGARDALSGLAMVVAKPGPGLRAAIIARVVCDALDVVGFGVGSPKSAKPKVMAVAAGWGAICATALPAATKV